MLRRILLSLALGLTLASPALATEPADMAAMMQEYMRVSKPGPGHLALQPLIGDWNCTTKMWWGGPGSPAVEDVGHASFKWVLDGHFIQQDFTGTMTMPDASGTPQKTPFKGMGMIGFDNFRNMYSQTWVDNTTTAMLVLSGSSPPRSKEIHFYGTMDEPGMKVVGRAIHYVVRWTDDDHFTYQMFDLHAAEDYKVMEITYVRKKP